MEDEDNLASYFKRFQTLRDPLLFFHYLSKKECNKLFWQGFHPDDYTTLFPYLIDKCSNQLPGDFDFREAFNIAYAVLSCRRLKAEAEAAQQRKLAPDLVTCTPPPPNITLPTTLPLSPPPDMPMPMCQAGSSQPRGPQPMHHATTMPLTPPLPLLLPPSSLLPSSLLPMPLLYKVLLPALSCSSPVLLSLPMSPIHEVLPPSAQSRPSPVLPPPLLLPTPLVHELLPTPSSIATASLNPSEATEAKTNSCRAQEQADISSIGNGNANLLTKLQTQAPQNTHNNPDSDIKDKTARNDSTGDNDNSTSSSTHTYPRGSSFNDCKLVHDPGGSTFNLNIKDSSTHDDSNGTNSSSTSSDLSYIVDTQHSYICDRDKTTFMASNADHHPPIDFVQATSPVPNVITLCSTDDFPAIFYDSLTCTDKVQHPLRHPTHLLKSDLEFDHKQSIFTDFAHSSPALHFSNNNNAISIQVIDTTNTALTNTTLVFNLATAIIASSTLAIATLTIVITTTTHTSGL